MSLRTKLQYFHSIVISKHSGRAALEARLKKLGIDQATRLRHLDAVAEQVKALADHQQTVVDESILEILQTRVDAVTELERAVLNHPDGSMASYEY